MPAQSSTPARPWSARLQTILGLLLASYAFYHAYQNYPALTHAEAWLDRAQASARLVSPIVLGWLVAAVMIGHAALGVQRVFAARTEASADQGRSGAIFQLRSGVLIALFVVAHLAQLWPSGAGMHASPRESYSRLWHELGRPLYLGLYVVGVTAVGFHLGNGVLRMLGRIGGRGPGALAKAAGGVIGFVILFLFMQLVARFAVGEQLVPALS